MSKWKREKKVSWRKAESRKLGPFTLVIGKYAKIGDAPGWQWQINVERTLTHVASGDNVKGKKNARKCTETMAKILKKNLWPDRCP